MPALPVLHCLGQFQLASAGQAIVLPTRKTVALLVYLVLHAETHPRERLATLFWGDSGEEEARRSLRNALSALRKALGETVLLADRELVQFNPDYALEVDAVDFRNQAQRFLTAPMSIPELVDITLYRGDLLDGFYDEWILREREKLRLLYLQVLLRLAQHWRTQGDYLQTIAIAQRILALDPAEEVAHQHLLFCYTMTGDRTAAQRQYDACVRALREELDVDPASETVALYRRSQQARPRKPSATAAYTNLPLPVSSFIGRGLEIAKLKALLLGEPETTQRPPARLVTITGPGGCGKTRLAIQVARALLDTYADGIWWVELAALSEESQVPQAVAKVLDVQQGVQSSLTDVLIANLRTKQALLVLDNCEHLVAACAELAERLLSHCPDLQILTTSREALGIFGETSWLVPSLTLPSTQLNAPADYLQFEAIRLFVERAQAVQQQFTIMPANAPTLLQICRQLDGIPLAIELAAARVKLMTVAQLAERLDNVIGARFALLDNGSRAVLPRQQTLRATVAWSYALLNEQEQRLFLQLAIFTGGWSLEAAEATGHESGQLPVASVLARLVDKSLVLVEVQGKVVRYRMLETVRQYAHERLEKNGDVAVARDRHLAYFRDLAEQGEPEFLGGGQLTWLRRLDADYENLRAAMVWGLQYEIKVGERLLNGTRLATALIFYWKIHGEWTEGRYWLEVTMQRLDIASKITDQGQFQQVTSLRAKALYGVGIAAWHQEKWAETRQLFDASADLWRVVGDRTGLYRTQIFQGDLCIVERNPTAAFPLWQECLAYFRQVQDRGGMAEANFFLGYGERRAGNLAVATRYYEECIALLRAIGERWLLSIAISHLGIIAWDQGDHAKAWPQIEQRLLMGREFGLKHHIYTSLGFLADFAYLQGDLRKSVALLRESMTIQRQVGFNLISTLMSSDRLAKIALVCAIDGENERATRLLAAHQALSFIDRYGALQVEFNETGQCLIDLRARLGADVFTKEWAIGAAMTPEQALEEALIESE